MEPSERDWRAAFARAQSEEDVEVQSDAFDVYLAEAGRRRLVDHRGHARVRLTSGTTLVGLLTGSAEVTDHLELVDDSGRCCLIPAAAVVTVAGTRAGLRPEPVPATRTVASWLRDVGAIRRPLAVLDVTGEWHHGIVDSVAADHVVLAVESVPVTLAYTAVTAWRT